MTDVKTGPARYRGWCFTYQLGCQAKDLTPDLIRAGGAALSASAEALTKDATVRCAIFQVEVSPSTDAAHVQGFVIFKHPRRLDSVREAMVTFGFPACHLEQQRGTPEQAWDYCTKRDSALEGLSPFTVGNRPTGSGSRNDLWSFLEQAKQLSARTVTLPELQETHYTVEARYTKYFDRVVGRSLPPRNFQTHCIVLYGDSGTGKSVRARAIARALSFSTYYLRLPEQKTGTLWFEQYSGEDAVLVDEMGPGKMQLSEFNSLIDQRPHLVNVKGASAHFLSKLMLFSSNYHPDDWFSDNARLRATVMRRINLLLHFKYGEVLPDDTFSNGEAVWRSAVVRAVKDDGVIKSLYPAVFDTNTSV
jgi:hypothetical protein